MYIKLYKNIILLLNLYNLYIKVSYFFDIVYLKKQIITHFYKLFKILQ